MTKRIAWLAPIVLGIVAALVVVTIAFGNAADPGTTVNVTVDPSNPLKITIDGNWIWDSQIYPCIDSRWVGWGIDWGDYDGNFLQSKGQAAGVGFHIGSPNGDPNNTDDNTISTNHDCGTSATGTGAAQGTWGPMTHTYAAPGSYAICAIM
jgi:hypothetical protein